MVQLSVTPVCYPEYRALLVQSYYSTYVLDVIYQQPEVQMTSCEGRLLFTFVKEN